MLTDIYDSVCDEVADGVDWLKHLLLGEFDETRSLSVVVATMLVCFVPGVVIVVSARDLTAVLVRLAKHPEKREHTDEWILLIACAVPLMIPVLAATAGLAVAGVGAVVGGVAGSEAAAFLRAVCLLLIRNAEPVLADVVGFLRKFVKGDILKVLKDIQFAQYEKAMVNFITGFIDKLIGTLRRAQTQLRKLPQFEALEQRLKQMKELEQSFYDVQTSAIEAIPKALADSHARLQRLLAQTLPHNPRLATPGVAAPMASMIDEGPRPIQQPLGQIGNSKAPASPPLKAVGKYDPRAPASKASEVAPPKTAHEQPLAAAQGATPKNVHPETPRQGIAPAIARVPPRRMRVLKSERLDGKLAEDMAQKYGGLPSDYTRRISSFTIVENGEPQVIDSYWIENVKTDRRYGFNYIINENEQKGLISRISTDGVVDFTIDAVGSPIRGNEMFDGMMQSYGKDVSQIQGNWISEAEGPMNKNLGVVNALTANGMPVEEAIHHAWTAQQSARYGFTVPQLETVTGTPGKFTEILTLWRKP